MLVRLDFIHTIADHAVFMYSEAEIISIFLFSNAAFIQGRFVLVSFLSSTALIRGRRLIE